MSHLSCNPTISISDKSPHCASSSLPCYSIVKFWWRESENIWYLEDCEIFISPATHYQHGGLWTVDLPSSPLNHPVSSGRCVMLTHWKCRLMVCHGVSCWHIGSRWWWMLLTPSIREWRTYTDTGSGQDINRKQIRSYKTSII